MSIGLQQIWAKTEPFQSILTHSFISGIVAQVIVHKMIVPGVRNKLLALLSCTPEKFTDWIGYLVSLHDVGKIEGQFQYRWLPMKESMDKEGVKPDFPALNQIRHEKTTWRCLRERLWKEASNQSAAKFYADILEVHHQGKSGTEGDRQDLFWNHLQEEFEHWMRLRFLRSEELFLPPLGKENRGSVGALLLGIVILSDWIASSNYFAQAELWINQPDGEEHAKCLAEKFLMLSGLTSQAADFGNEFHDVCPIFQEM